MSDDASRAQRTFTLRPRYLLAGIGLVLVAFLAFWFISGRLTGEMLKDHGYYLWAHGEGHYEPKYLGAFARDSRFQHRFVGQPVDSLHAFFPHLWGGPGFSINRLKQVNPGHQFQSSPGEWYGSYWLDQTQHGLVYVALLVDGKVVDFCWVRRDS